MDLIRCAHCQAVFDSELMTCPRCGRDPDRRSAWRIVFWAIGLLGVLAMLVLMLIGG